MINSYFDKIFCINLDRRPERWEECSKEFQTHSLDVERIAAVDGNAIGIKSHLTNGEIGCSMSHASILKKIIDSQYKRVLVLEDDTTFVESLQDKFHQARQHIPEEWDMLYFGGNHINAPARVNQFISKTTRTYTTAHYGISLKMAEKAVSLIEKFEKQVDVVYADLHRGSRCFSFTPPLAWQRPGFSDIQNGFTDYLTYLK